MKKIKCKICGKKFKRWEDLSRHVVYEHNIVSQKYYDKYFKIKNKGKCLTCKKQTKYKGLVGGYSKFCSHSCRAKYWQQGKRHSRYGARLSKVQREKIGKAHTGIPLSKEHRRKISIGNKGKNTGKACSQKTRLKISLTKLGVRLTEDHKFKLAYISKNRWANDIEYRNKVVSNAIKGIKKNFNLAEIKLQLLLDEHFPIQWYFVGDGYLVIDGRCPDFVCFSQNKIIELFGDYWHRNETIKTIKDRKDIYKKEDYKTLIVWESELKNENRLVKKLIRFNS